MVTKTLVPVAYHEATMIMPAGNYEVKVATKGKDARFSLTPQLGYRSVLGGSVTLDKQQVAELIDGLQYVYDHME